MNSIKKALGFSNSTPNYGFGMRYGRNPNRPGQVNRTGKLGVVGRNGRTVENIRKLTSNAFNRKAAKNCMNNPECKQIKNRENQILRLTANRRSMNNRSRSMNNRSRSNVNHRQNNNNN